MQRPGLMLQPLVQPRTPHPQTTAHHRPAASQGCQLAPRSRSISSLLAYYFRFLFFGFCRAADDLEDMLPVPMIAAPGEPIGIITIEDVIEELMVGVGCGQPACCA
jgi:hypothetical protein